MNKAVQEILPFLFLYLLKYIQSSSICFSSHSSYGYRVTAVPPPLSFCFLLLSDIPVGSPNGPSAWGDACSVSSAGLEGSTLLPRWLQALAPLSWQGGAASWHGSTTQPGWRRGQRPRREGKQQICTRVGKRACRPGPTAGVPCHPGSASPFPRHQPQLLSGQDFPAVTSLWKSWGAHFRHGASCSAAHDPHLPASTR